MCKPNKNGRVPGYVGCEIWNGVSWSDGTTTVTCPTASRHFDKRPKLVGGSGLKADAVAAVRRILAKSAKLAVPASATKRIHTEDFAVRELGWHKKAWRILDFAATEILAMKSKTKALIFGCEVAGPTKFGTRPGPRGPRQSGPNPTEKGRQNELTANQILEQRNPDLYAKDVAKNRVQLGCDTILCRRVDDVEVAAIDTTSGDKVVQENEWQAMLKFAERGIPYYLFLSDSQKLYPLTPDMPTQIASRRV